MEGEKSSLQMSANSLFGCYMIDVRSSDPQPTLLFGLTTGTNAIFFDGVEVVGESGVT